MANWVRFADTKATILAAGLGVVVTLLTNSTGTVLKAMNTTCGAKMIVGGLAAVTVVSFLWTLFWVVNAITPRNTVSSGGLNRFAWPSLIGVSADKLLAHVESSEVEVDAWRQVIDLASIADSKFASCKKAINGFALMIVFGVFTVLSAAGFTAS